MTNKEYPSYFAAHTEIQDASRVEELVERLAPGAASIEIAKILTVFDGQIDDAWRHSLVLLGGALFKLQCAFDKEDGND